MQPEPLKGKIALVTGGSRGIGRAIVQKLGQAGAVVGFTYHSRESQADETAAELKEKGVEAFALRMDLRSIESIERSFQIVKEKYGKLDILVNNAAGRNVFKPTEFMSVDEFDSMFAVTRGVYFALQNGARQIEDNGRIINISTGGTAMAIPAGGAYAGSKAAIEHFSMALAKELGARGIAVNTVRPGVTRTEGLVLDPNQVAGLIQQTPMGRLGEPDDVAGAVLTLVLPEAGWITAQNIAAAGGIV